MRIAFINGSPKLNNSASGVLLSDLKSCFFGEMEIVEIGLHKKFISKDSVEKLKNTDSWVFSFPLYVDGIPGHLLSCLIQLEKLAWKDRGIYIYGIANCGFYEGIQTELSLKVLQNWCIKSGFIWGGGIGIGGGSSLAHLPKMKRGYGPKAPINKALGAIAGSIMQQKVQKNHYVSVGIPRFPYKIIAQMEWRWMIKANGGTAKDLEKQLE